MRRGLFLIVVTALVAGPLGACLERGKKKGDRSRSTSSGEPAALPDSRRVDLDGPADPEASLKVAVLQRPRHLQPMIESAHLAVQLTRGDVYEGLMGIERPGAAPVPALAATVTPSDDGRRWRVALRNGVRFHDGSPVSTEDVVQSYELARQLPGTLAADLDDLLELRVDEGTLLFVFREARPARSEIFARVPILPASCRLAPDESPRAAALVQRPCARAPIGTGPMRVASWKGDELALVRFDDYWGEPAMSAEIRYLFVEDRTRLRVLLEGGALDAVLDLPAADAAELASLTGYAPVARSYPAYTALLFNCGGGGLSPPLRRALWASVDRETFSRELFEGFGRLAHSPYPEGSTRAEPGLGEASGELSERVADLALLLAASKTSSIELLVPESSSTMRRYARMWARDLSRMLRLEVRPMEFAELLSRVGRGDYQVALLSFTSSDDVDLYSQLHSSHVGDSNLSRLASPQVDELLGALRTASGDEAQTLSRELHRLLMELMPLGFLQVDVRLSLVRDKVGGLGDDARRWGARALWRRR